MSGIREANFLEDVEELLASWMDVQLRLDTECLDIVTKTSTDKCYCGVTIETISFTSEDRHFVEIDLFLLVDESEPLQLMSEHSELKKVLESIVQGELRWSKIDFNDVEDSDDVTVSLTRNELVSGHFDNTDAKRVNDIVEEMEGEYEAVHRFLMFALASTKESFNPEETRMLLAPPKNGDLGYVH
ncbi:MAG: hypothetical protein AAGA35_03310 [Patescibacteria group bacterium]